MSTCYTTKQAKRIAMIKAAVIKVKARKAFAVRVRIEDRLTMLQLGQEGYHESSSV